MYHFTFSDPFEEQNALEARRKRRESEKRRLREIPQ
jgi:hypothetical protein